MLESVAHVNLAKGFRGGERQTVLLIKYLAINNPSLKQYLVCRKNAEILKYVKDIPNLTIITANNALQGHFSLAKKVNIIQAHEAKAVHWAAIHNLLFKTPYVIARRVPQFVKHSWFNCFTYNNSSAIVAVSKAIANNVAKSFLDTKVVVENKTTVIFDALSHLEADSEEVANIKKQYQGCTVIGHIGAYVDKHKGQKVLIEAAKKLLSENHNLRFIFLGNGKDEAEFRTLTHDIKEIKWLGFKDNVVDYMECMDIFAFPSRNEGLGSVLLDVMDHKVPIVASNVDGIPEIVIDNNTGLLFKNESSEDLSNKLKLLIQDEQLRNKLVERAYKNLENFTPEHIATLYKNLYESIIKNSKR